MTAIRKGVGAGELDALGWRPEQLAGWWVLPARLGPARVSRVRFRARLFRVPEIFADDASSHRKALANVYASLDAGADGELRFLYLIAGDPQGVHLYFGVLAPQARGAALQEGEKLLEGSLAGQLPGLALERVPEEACGRIFSETFEAPERGLLLGVPDAPTDLDDTEEDFQGFERLVRALLVGPQGRSGERWRMAVVTRPLTRERTAQALDEALALAGALAPLARVQAQYGANTGEQTGLSQGYSTSRSTNRGRSTQRGRSEGASTSETRSTSRTKGEARRSDQTGRSEATGKTTSTQESVTRTEGEGTSRGRNYGENWSRSSGTQVSFSAEIIDKKLGLLLDHLEERLIPRLRRGHARGLLETRVLLSADTPSAFRRLRAAVLSVFQGDTDDLTPLEVLEVPAQAGRSPWLEDLDLSMPPWQALVHSRPAASGAATWLTPEELAVLAGLPQRELPGIARRPTADFALDLPRPADGRGVRLGPLVDHGRELPDLPLTLARDEFNQHLFVTGVTGSGKTTTCLKLLRESGLPFLVVEPAKTEYRALAAHDPDLVLYRPLADPHDAFRLNPMALTHRRQRLPSHIEFLSAALSAAFPMEASMPYLVKEAIGRAYEARGWDVEESEWLPGADPFAPGAGAWPTLSEMILALDRIIPEQGMGREFEEKYRGSLVSRLNDLTRGPLGRVLDVRESIDLDALLDARVVLELEEVRSPEAKALLMALVLGALGEAVKARHARDPGFRHLCLVEEAHRLLARPEPGADDSRRLAVERFADLLAEVRKYGEGLIVVDQIPAKLIPDVLKNTHIKIAHRLFAADDRQALGDAMMMNEAQRDFLPKLATGQALVYCGGWHMPAQVAVRALEAGLPPLDDSRLDARAERQLWAQRHRFHPTLARLGFPDEPAAFARFVRDARRALNAWLALLPRAAAHGRHRRARVRVLTGFRDRWRPAASAAQAGWAAWRAAHAPGAPRDLLAAAWLACACDLVPLQRVAVQEARPLGMALDSPAWAAAMDVLTASLDALAADGDALPDPAGPPRGRDWTPSAWDQARTELREVEAQLVHYERF